MRRSIALAMATFALLALVACGGSSPGDGPPGDDAASETDVTGVSLSLATPAIVDSGSIVRAEITVRTDEPDGVRVRLQPYAAGLDTYPFTYRVASDLLTGPDASGEAYFGTVVADEDVAFDGVRVRVTAADGGLLVDEVVEAPITFRSLATTDVTLAPVSGSLDQGRGVAVQADFALDRARNVLVSVGPMAPLDYDETESGDWFDVNEVASDSYANVAAGTLSGSFTVLDDAVGAVQIERVFVSILDTDIEREIYARYLPLDVTFVEPSP